MFVTVTICMNYFKEIKVPERAGTPSLCFSGFVSRALARSVLFLASACGAELDGQLRGVHAGLRLLWLLEPLALCVLTGTWGSSLLCVRCHPLPPGGPEPGGPRCSVHGLSCSVECRIFTDQRSNLCLLHWQADSSSLSLQGSPEKTRFEC